MKVCITILAVAVALFGLSNLYAQDSELRAPAPEEKKKIYQEKSTSSKLKAKPTGIIVMMSEHGLEVINPAAPPALGKGEKYLAADVSDKPMVGDGQTDKKPFGGIQFFGFLF